MHSNTHSSLTFGFYPHAICKAAVFHYCDSPPSPYPCSRMAFISSYSCLICSSSTAKLGIIPLHGRNVGGFEVTENKTLTTHLGNFPFIQPFTHPRVSFNLLRVQLPFGEEADLGVWVGFISVSQHSVLVWPSLASQGGGCSSFQPVQREPPPPPPGNKRDWGKEIRRRNI